ncbi:MAG: MarR family transcriptional regulator [Syntrophales bacterium]|nr:MarR family transcriptional regulator [Syntrophales bacterium]
MVSDDRVIYLIFTAQQKLRTYLNAALAAEGLRVTYAQAGILFLLKHKSGRSMTELSQFLGTDNSTMTGLVDRLEKAGFVSRNSNPGDRRLSDVYITEQGLNEINRAKSVIRRVNEEVKSGFTSREVENFKNMLNSFFEKFSIKENKNRTT